MLRRVPRALMAVSSCRKFVSLSPEVKPSMMKIQRGYPFEVTPDSSSGTDPFEVKM